VSKYIQYWRNTHFFNWMEDINLARMSTWKQTVKQSHSINDIIEHYSKHCYRHWPEQKCLLSSLSIQNRLWRNQLLLKFSRCTRPFYKPLTSELVSQSADTSSKWASKSANCLYCPLLINPLTFAYVSTFDSWKSELSVNDDLLCCHWPLIFTNGYTQKNN
jgi:hypothetical protein